MTISIGLAGALGPAAIAGLAPRIEAAGFDSLWVNDTPGGDSIAALAAAAGETTTLRLATGVIPIDRRPAADILPSLRTHAIDPARLTIGIGSGALRRGALDAVRRAALQVRTGTDAGVVIGALGPRMRALAAEASDGVLLNWLTPEAARDQAAELHAGHPGARAVLYVRTITDPAAFGALEAESARYGSYPAYAANLARLGVAAIDTTLGRDGDIAAGLGAYRDAVDEVVLRAITPSGDADALRAFIDTAAQALGR